MNVRIIIDSQDFTDSVINLESVEERLYRSDELKGFLTEVNGSITLTGESYDYVRANFRQKVFTSFLVQISEQDPSTGVWTRIFSGEIQSKNITFDMVKKQADCELTDLNFVRYIEANRKVEATIGVNLSVTGTFIPSPTINQFDFFEITNYNNTNSTYAGGSGGTITMNLTDGYYTYDALKYLVEFMSDGQLLFHSDFFDYTNPANFFGFTGIFSGEQLRNTTGVSPRISWDDFFLDLNRIFNVWFTIDYVGDRPRVRVEPYDFFIRQGQNPEIEALELAESIDKSVLYNRIFVGCSRQDRGFVPEQSVFYHTQDEYTAGLSAAEDALLDLRMKKLIISSNSIKRALPVRLRGGHELTPFVLVRGRQIAGPTPFVLEDNAGREFDTNNVSTGMLAVNYTSKLACAVGAPAGITIPTEQNIFLGNQDYQVFENDTEYDQEVFFVCFTSSNQARLKITDAPNPAVGGPNIGAYNVDINNYSVIQRYIAMIPGSVLQVAIQGSQAFDAGLVFQTMVNNYIEATAFPTLTTTPPWSDPNWTHKLIDFPEDAVPPAFNSGGGYNPATGRFTIPAAAGGIYGFRTKINIADLTPSSFQDTALYVVSIIHYDTTGNIINLSSQTRYVTPSNVPPTVEVVVDAVFNMAVSDYAVVVISKAHFGFPANGTTYRVFDVAYNSFNGANGALRAGYRTFFRTLTTPDAGGLVATASPTQVEAIIDEVTGYVDGATWNAIKANPYVGCVLHFGQNKAITARIREIVRNISDGAITATMQRNIDFNTNLLNE